MDNRASTLIIPVENQCRELDAKLLLSCIAAERGFPVVLGSRTFIHFEVASLPRGVYLAKSMRSLSERMFDILRQLGHEIVAWDEEGLVRLPDAQYWERRLSPKTSEKVAALMAWGPDDARVFREYPGHAGAPIYITGNPRVDVMRREFWGYYDREVEQIRERFGNFILVNTNFGWTNHFLPRFNLISAEVADPFLAGLVDHRAMIFEAFKEMIPILAGALPESTILVRPHPVESHAPWNQIAEEFKNVAVANEGNVIPWLLACDALVHNSCTTAVEGFILERPVFAYEPQTVASFDNELPSALSTRVSNVDELIRRLRAVLAGSREVDELDKKRERLERHIAALEGPLASERMVEILEKHGYAERQPPRPSLGGFLTGAAHTKLRTTVKRINMRRRGHRNSIEYHDHRFPQITVAELREKVSRLGRQLDRFERVRIRQRSDHLFEIDCEADRSGGLARSARVR
jgi:surface carbohydrate biosynthesis protein